MTTNGQILIFRDRLNSLIEESKLPAAVIDLCLTCTLNDVRFALLSEKITAKGDISNGNSDAPGSDGGLRSVKDDAG